MSAAEVGRFETSGRNAKLPPTTTVVTANQVRPSAVTSSNDENFQRLR